MSSGSDRRLLFIAHSSGWNGANHSLFLLARYLRDDFGVSVVVPGAGAFWRRLEDEEIRAVPIASLRRESIRSLVRIINDGCFDVVYANTTSNRGARNALIAAKLARRSFIGHFRTMPKPRMLTHPRSLFRYAHLNLAAAIICVSRAVADGLRGSVLRRKIRVVHNGVELSEFARLDGSVREKLRRELGVRPGQLLALSVGQLHPRKGQHRAVQAVAEAVERGVDVKLVIVGRAELQPAYARRVRDRARELGIDDRVHFAGFRTDVPDLLRASDILVHAAESEGFGRVVAEAMAARVPVVAYPTDGVAEIVSHGETGYLVGLDRIDSLGTALVATASDPTARTRMGDRGRARAQRLFSAEQTARSVGAVVTEVCYRQR